MKFYIAARFNQKDKVERITNKIRFYRHDVISTWSQQNVVKPYNKRPRLSGKYAALFLDEIDKSDVFVLLSDRGGTGMYFELGYAVRSFEKNKKPLVYVVGKYLSKSIFYFLPNVRCLPDIESVIKDLESI